MVCAIFPKTPQSKCHAHQNFSLFHHKLLLEKKKIAIVFFFFFWPPGMWDPSSPTRDQTHPTPCIGSAES